MTRTDSCLASKRIGSEPDAIAPDGSEVRLLCGVSRGGMATFTLGPFMVSRAVAHRSVEEVWYFLSGTGRMWRSLGEQEDITEVGPGVSVAIPTGARFQFRCDGDAPLVALGATMPPWPGDSEALHVPGKWEPTV